MGGLLGRHQARLGVQVERARRAEPASGGAVARRAADGGAVPGGGPGAVRLCGAHHQSDDRSGLCHLAPPTPSLTYSTLTHTGAHGKQGTLKAAAVSACQEAHGFH